MIDENRSRGDVAPPTNRPPHGPLRRFLTALLVLAAFAFLALAVARDWNALRAYDWSIRPGRLLLSLPTLLAAFCVGVYIWERTLAAVDGPVVSFPALLRIWFLSTLARYIPGKIWQFVGAARMAHAAGLPAPLLLTSLVVSMGFNVLAAALVGAATIPGAGILPEEWRGPLALAVFTAAVLAVHPVVLNACLRLVPRALHQTVLSWRGGWGTGIRLLVLSALGWLIYGFAFWLFVGALTDVDAALLAPLAGVNALAFLAGYLVVIAPAGLGARELSMTALLVPLLGGGTGVAALVAIASRLWIVAGELIGAGLLLLIVPRRPQSGPPAASPNA
jgi:hypothetical protein